MALRGRCCIVDLPLALIIAAVVAVAPERRENFVQEATEPKVAHGLPASTGLTVTWETRAERDRPRVLGQAAEQRT